MGLEENVAKKRIHDQLTGQTFYEGKGSFNNIISTQFPKRDIFHFV